MPFRFLLVPFGFILAAFAAAPADADALARNLAAAISLRDEAKHAEAKVAFEKVIAAAPDQPEANYQLALYACDRGEWEKALAYASKAVTQQPNTARYQYSWGAANGVSALKAGVFSKFGYARKCLAGYQRAVELDPKNVQYRFSLLSYYQQAPGVVGGGMEKAYAEAGEIKKLNREYGRQAFAQIFLAEKKPELALREYEGVLQEDPPSYQSLYNLGRLTLMTSRQLDDGLAALRRCLELTPPDRSQPSHANVHWRIGSALEQLGRLEDARAEYETALKLQPDFSPARRAIDKLNAKKT